MAVPVEGIQGRGKAGVFGTGINPLQVYLQQQARNQKGAADLYEQERKRRDDVISDLRKFNPDKVWEPFYEEVNKFAQSHVRDYTFKALEANAPISALNYSLEKRKGEVNTMVNKINWLKSQYEDAQGQLEKNPYYKTDAQSALNDIFFDGRQARVSSDIKADQIQGVFDNPDNFNTNAIVIDFMKSLPLKVNEKWSNYYNQLGQQYNIQETQTKLGLQYVPGPDGKPQVVIDPRTGQPKISMTDDVFVQAMENPYIEKIVEKQVPDRNVAKQKEVVTALLEGYDPKTIQNRQQLGFKDDDNKFRYFGGIDFGIGNKVPPQDVLNRFEETESVVTGYEPGKLARFVDQTKGEAAYYLDVNGNKIVETITEPDGRIRFVNDKGGGSYNPPKSIVLEKLDPKKAEIDIFKRYEIESGPGTDQEKAEKLAKLKRPMIPVKFDISTKNGRFNAHSEISDILDQKYSKGQSYKEAYDKVMKAKYGDNKKMLPADNL